MGAGRSRIDWIDYAKGICIVLVVMLYAVEWIDGVTGGRDSWLHRVVEFAQPFRMPDFFLVSGLLPARTIGRDWAAYLDRKVLHFAYFYVLWLTIAFVLLGPWMAAKGGWDATGALYLRSFVRPYSWLWFIYMLPVFFVVTKLAVRLPAALVWTAAAALHVAALDTNFKVFDKFAQYYVFFYSGYAFAPLAFRLAAWAAARPRTSLLALAAWAAFEAYVVFGGYSSLPLVSLGISFIGIAAVIGASALMPASRLFDPLRYCGANSIVIYLAFFIPGMAARIALTRLNLVDDPGTMALLVTFAGVVGALLMYWTVRDTRLRFLFSRPAWFAWPARRAAATA